MKVVAVRLVIFNIDISKTVGLKAEIISGVIISFMLRAISRNNKKCNKFRIERPDETC